MKNAGLVKVLAIAIAVILSLPLVLNLEVFDQAIDADVARAMDVQSLSEKPGPTYRAIVELVDSNTEQWEGFYTACTARTQLGCLKIVQDDLGDHPIEPGSELATMLARYQEVTGMTGYQSAGGSQAGFRLPRWGLLLRLGGLNLANQSLSGTGEFIEAVERDTRFWAMLFKQSQGMLEKMVAVAGLWTNLQFVSEFAADRPLGNQERNQLEAILAGSKLDAARLTPAYLAEFRNLATLISAPHTSEKAQMMGVDKWQVTWFLQENATLNAYFHKIIEPAIRLAEQAGSKAIPLLKAPAGEVNGHSGTGSGSSFITGVFYNPVGNSIIKSAANISDYIARVHDLNGMLGLVQYQLAEPGGPSVQLEQFVEPALTLSKEEGSLSFACTDGQSLCRIDR